MAIPRNLSNLAPGADTSGVLGVAKGGTGAASLTGIIKGSGTSAFTAGNVNLASEVTGTLPTANGGTGLTSVGTNGQVLQSNGTTLSWATPSSGAMALVSTQTLSGGANLVEWTGISSATYYRIEYKGLYFGSSQYWLRLQAGTSSYVTSGYSNYVNYMGGGLAWSAQSNGSDAFSVNILNDPTTQKYFGYIDIMPSTSQTSIIGISNTAGSGSAPIFPAIALGYNTAINNPTRFKLESTNGTAPLYGTFSLYTIT